jgi:hypothetical protein
MPLRLSYLYRSTARTRAQQPKLPKVGLLNGVSFEGPYAGPVAAIRQGLQEAGFVEGQNLAIEYRSADGEYERLLELAAEERCASRRATLHCWGISGD